MDLRDILIIQFLNKRRFESNIILVGFIKQLILSIIVVFLVKLLKSIRNHYELLMKNNTISFLFTFKNRIFHYLKSVNIYIDLKTFWKINCLFSRMFFFDLYWFHLTLWSIYLRLVRTYIVLDSLYFNIVLLCF